MIEIQSRPIPTTLRLRAFARNISRKGGKPQGHVKYKGAGFSFLATKSTLIPNFLIKELLQNNLSILHLI